MRTIQRDIAGAVIISSDNKVLLGRTAPSRVGVYSGQWVIPGGGIDEGETREQAVLREVLEETNIDASDQKLELLFDDRSGRSTKVLQETGEHVEVEMNFIEFKISMNQTAEELGVHPTEELVELHWFSVDELGKAPIAEPTVELLKRINFMTSK